MLIPIVNLVIKNNEIYKNYDKTILLNLHELSLTLKDSKDLTENNVFFTYEILEPIDMSNDVRLEYNDCCYKKELYVPIFKKGDSKKREEYINGATKLIDLVKYPCIDSPGNYSVEEIAAVTFAGTDNSNKDNIFISISLYNGFTETYEAEELIRAKARDKIRDTIKDFLTDETIEEINTKRKNSSLTEINYEYGMLGNKSYLMNFNLADLIEKNQEKDPYKLLCKEEIDLSIFDYLSTNCASNIILSKSNLLKSNLSIIVNQNQMERLMEMDFTKQTWKKYITQGLFVVK